MERKSNFDFLSIFTVKQGLPESQPALPSEKSATLNKSKDKIDREIALESRDRAKYCFYDESS